MRVELTTDRVGWSAALSELGGHDFAHTLDFHEIARDAGEGEPQAFVVRADDGRPWAFWPVLRRPIPGTHLFDLTSVYGYAGPLVRPGSDAGEALGLVLAEMRRQGAVAVFSRMHPLYMDRLPEGRRGMALGDVVVIEVGEDPDVMKTYRGSHRREIVNAAKKGVKVRQEVGPAATEAFHAIYHEAMRDLAADQYYFFNLDYLKAMADAVDFQTLLLFAELKGRKIAASMFVITGAVMQYYLSGSLSEFRRYAPAKAIIAEAHRIAAEEGVERIVLGGGLGSRQDALFNFKRGFSPVTAPFHVIREVLDPDRYAELCRVRGIDAEQERYFPAYRAPRA